MAPSFLLRKQANQVLKSITGHGFARNEFEWTVEGGSTRSHPQIDVLIHRPTGYYFKFDYSDGDAFGMNSGRRPTWSPGSDSRTGYQISNSWLNEIGHLPYWLKNIRAEQEPNLWVDDNDSDFKEWSTSDDLISDIELPIVIKALEKMEKTLIEHSDKSDQTLKQIADSVEYLKESAKGARKRDFINLVMGVLAGQLVSLIKGVDWIHVFHIFLQTTSIGLSPLK